MNTAFGGLPQQIMIVPKEASLLCAPASAPLIQTVLSRYTLDYVSGGRCRHRDPTAANTLSAKVCLVDTV